MGTKRKAYVERLVERTADWLDGIYKEHYLNKRLEGLGWTVYALKRAVLSSAGEIMVTDISIKDDGEESTSYPIISFV